MAPDDDTVTPRIAPLPPRAWPAEMREALAPLRPTDPRHPLPPTEGRPKGLNVLGTFAHHPELTRAFMVFNSHVLNMTTLEARQRELIVLRVAALRDADYEWAQHAVLAGDHGIDDDALARVRSGPDAPGWSSADAALIRAVDELVSEATIGDETWAALGDALDEQQLLDLVFTVGAYDTLAMMMRACRTPLDDDLAPT